jgi:hypothetical protein
MSEGRRRRLSYLLRLWQAEQGGAWVWRASLENAQTGERRGFASLATLFGFLKKETAAPNDRTQPSPMEGDGSEKPRAHPESEGKHHERNEQ